jgi:hypothetical protein
MNTRLLFFLAVVPIALITAVRLPAEPTQGSDAPIALVIGNAAYSAGPHLTTPVLRARLMAEELRHVGFDVELSFDLTREGMQQAIERFAGRIRPGAGALIFFSGHATEINQQSYLVPVDSRIAGEEEVRRDGMSLESVLAQVHAREPRAMIAIVDACWASPFVRPGAPVSGGLAPVSAPARSLVMYCAAPGQVADDGDAVPGLFVGELAKEMRNSGLTIEDVFRRTRIGVSRASDGRQVPWISSSLLDNPFLLRLQFSTPSKVSEVPRPEPPQKPEPQLTDLFPWPPPTPSTRRSFSADVAADASPARTAGEVAARLEDLLTKAEFDTWGYFRTPGGFALVTRTERLDAATGRPLAGHQRWSDQIAPAGIALSTIFGWSRPRGLYRVLVFILTDDPPMSRPLGAAETYELTRRWPLTGRASLPAAVRADVVGQSHQLVVLVYEFEKGQGSTTTHNVPSRWSLDHHLQTVRMSLKPLR